MVKPYDARLIGVVAQDQFEVDLNRFCKISPVVFADGAQATPGDFPNDGEVWWMLSAQAAMLTNPGRLVSCHVEDAREYNEHDPTKSRYQVQRESVRDLNSREDGLEILTIASDALDGIQDLVSSGYQMTCDHRPSPTVLLRWRGDVYGPFAATVEEGDSNLQFLATFAPANTDMTVYHIPTKAFSEAAESACLKFTTEVSPSQHRRSECFNLRTMTHELVLASGFERVLATHPDKLILEPIDRKLIRFAKQCLTRKKRQELQALLKELELAGHETTEAQELADAVGHIRATNEKQDAALDMVSKALLESGSLSEDRLRKAEQEYAEKYVQDRTAELQAKIEANLVTLRADAREAETSLKEMQSRLQREETEGRAKLKAKLEAETKQAHENIEAARAKLDRDKAELQRQEQALKQNLEKVTEELRDAGDDVVNKFLAIAPLLGTTIPTAQDASPRGPDAGPQRADETAAPVFAIPPFITAEVSRSDEPLDEKCFFDRFLQVVENNGFSYRHLDLQRFHVSIKCGDLTILGGPSGTGKSSLPALYAQALLGGDGDAGRSGCLMININPAWMDVRDLLGHLNTLERRYYPAESGLYQRLVYAQEEYSRRSHATGLYLTCLDEMNLSQVEHYFSDFMMTLERRGDDRVIQCFSAETIGERCPFREWGRITLAPSLRFVGTVNFDETTRLLSDRLLDRANLIRLASGALPSAAAAGEGAFARADGPMVTLADFQAWQRDAALPADLGSLLDSLRPSLSAMGCPLSPRVYRAVCRYVGSSNGVMSPGIAFDTQLSQRVIPKIRNLVTRSQLDALDITIQTLEGSSVGAFDESLELLAEIRESAQLHGWDLGD